MNRWKTSASSAIFDGRQEALCYAEQLGKPVGRLMLTLGAQSAFSQILYQLYSLTDTFFVANAVGTLASGAIGIVSPVLTLISGISTTLGTGGASMISRHLGEENTSQSKAVVGCMIFAWLVCSLTVTAMGLVFLKPVVSTS